MQNSVEHGQRLDSPDSHDHGDDRALYPTLNAAEGQSDLSAIVEALAEAASSSHPTLRRLDAARRATARLDRLYANSMQPRVSGMSEGSGAEQRDVHEWAHRLQSAVVELLHSELFPLLPTHGLQLSHLEQLDSDQRETLYRYYQSRVYPLLTPLAVDPGHPFPFISTNSLNLLVEVRHPGSNANPTGVRAYARVKLPRSCPLLVAVPLQMATHAHEASSAPVLLKPATQQFVFTSELIRYHINELFTGIEVENVYMFRLLRAAEASATMGSGMRAVRGRNRPVARLDVDDMIPDEVLAWLVTHLQVEPLRVLRYPNIASPVCLTEVIKYATHLPKASAAPAAQYRDDSRRTSVAA